MEAALELARSKGANDRMAGVERLLELLEASRRSLSVIETASLVECCFDLFKDANFRVSQGALQALASAAVLSGDHLQLHLAALIPAVVDRLGDSKQPVRDASRRLLLTLMEVSSPTIIVERAGSYAWIHKSGKVREEFARTVTSAVGLFASTELPLQRAILPPILQMLNNSNHGARGAAMLCIEEMYKQSGSQFSDELRRYHLPSFMVKEINARLKRIEPRIQSPGVQGSFPNMDMKLITHSPEKSCLRVRSFRKERSLIGADGDQYGKRIEPINVYSEKELIWETEKIFSNLVPEKDWSARIAAMQRLEGLILGGAASYSCFKGLLKQLAGSLCTQLSDRRSSIVKQACNLLCCLSKELLGEYATLAEIFIPVLLKLVVITVLVIAESADNCIKVILQNCNVARVLPHIVDRAKSDRSAVLRARCCEYALLMLEKWIDSPEMQRSVDLYEDLLRCCVADAMSEVRSTARMCYRLFSKNWPDRSRHLFSSFDSNIQRIINEEDRGSHKQYSSSSPLLDGTSRISCTNSSARTILSGFNTSMIDMDDGTRTSLSYMHSPQAKSLDEGGERTPDIIPHGSQKKISSVDTMLKLEVSDMRNHFLLRSSSLNPASVDLSTSSNIDSTIRSRSQHNGDLTFSTERGSGRFPGKSSTFIQENYGTCKARRAVSLRNGRYFDNPQKEENSSDMESNYVPNFQRARELSSSRSLNGCSLLLDEVSSRVYCPASLSDKLTEGLSSSSDWSARVSAFNHVQSLLQQGSKGVQEVIQYFDKVMKLFFKHLDDPHHKVAHAALSTLSDIIKSCRKPYESYMDRMLPHVFCRLIDPKDLVKQTCSMTLKILRESYTVDALLPALIRSLDEQRSPKAKLAVIEFSLASFNKYSGMSEGSRNSGILKLWLAKLTPLVCDKNARLKEAAISCIVSVYTHYDQIPVLNFIISLSIEEQSALRRALKQHTPRIEVDLLDFLQSKKERQRFKDSYDSCDLNTFSEEGYTCLPSKIQPYGRYSADSAESDNGKKWSSARASNISAGGGTASDAILRNLNCDSTTSEGGDLFSKSSQTVGIQSDWTEDLGNMKFETLSSLSLEFNGAVGSPLMPSGRSGHDEAFVAAALSPEKTIDSDGGPDIPQILRLIVDEDDKTDSSMKQSALQKLVELSGSNDILIRLTYFNQILTTVLGVLGDSDPSIRELAISLLLEMNKNQKEMMEESVEIVIKKLLLVTKDTVMKVAERAEDCLNTLVLQYEPLRCLSAIAALLVTEDEKSLITCINCLTKVVRRISQEELMVQLPSFLPAICEAFGNPSPEVRKNVVFCLVEIYIILGKAFLPHLKCLNSMQLRLVNIYADRVSQAHTGAGEY